ncbi:MAG: dTMP kinase [Jaaginema sp. PMC 1079.18]|nr:dTMP kinase [Jaaginema sp. PMC 1080.18]MEC4853247.1 dTMP kinase [Jaaginema sp. PMC 1079.18]MEC4867961.1 dTMP kinase [Jaaginema sp. PMC 1078.18]
MGGKLIVFEGGEGAGKTTQIRRIHHWLNSALPPYYTVQVTQEPGGTALGQEIRTLLLGEHHPSNLAELLLYAADRAHHVEQDLKPALANHTIMLCDRYTDSTVAYQGYGRGLDLKLIAELNQIATQGLESDLTLWLDVPVEIGLLRAQNRGKRDRIEQADLAFHQRVHHGFQSLAQQFPHRIHRIDANTTEIEVERQIQAVLQSLVLPN